MVSRFVAAESLANPYFSRFLPSHPALSRVSQISCLFTLKAAVCLLDNGDIKKMSQKSKKGLTKAAA